MVAMPGRCSWPLMVVAGQARSSTKPIGELLGDGFDIADDVEMPTNNGNVQKCLTQFL